MCRERKPAVWVWGDTNRRGTSAGLNWCSNTCFWSKYCELLFFTKKLKHCWSTVVIQEVRVHTSNWDLTFARSLSKGETRCHGNQSVTFRSFISQPSGPSLKASASISINPKPHSESKKMRNACVKVRCQWKCRWDSTLCWLAKCSASLDFILKILHTYLKTSTASSQSQTGMCQPSENTQPDPSLFRRELERIHLKQLLEPSGLCADACVCVWSVLPQYYRMKGITPHAPSTTLQLCHITAVGEWVRCKPAKEAEGMYHSDTNIFLRNKKTNRVQK